MEFFTFRTQSSMKKIKCQPVVNFKNICCLFFLILSINSKGQSIADPATGQLDLTDQSGISMNTNYLAPGTTGTLLVPIYNLHQLVPLQPGTCKFIINLGPNMILDPSFNLANAPLSNYFTWTSAVIAGNLKITGDLKGTFPADYYGTAEFKIIANQLGTSIIESDFLVTNHNTGNILSDEDPQNNSSSLTYIVTYQILPVKFTRFTLSNKDCNIQVNFSAENEVNVKRYEIEMSKDAVNYKKTGQITASNKIDYKFVVNLPDDLKGIQIFTRIKSLDADGKFQYSETKTIDSFCDKNISGVTLYPNPAFNTITIKTTRGSFNGKYAVALLDITGRIIKNELYDLVNSNGFNYQTKGLPQGVYYIKIENTKDQFSTSLRVQKL